MRYVFRLTPEVLERLDAAAPPKKHLRSGFVRDAITMFLKKSKESLADRPHLRGRTNAYKQVGAILTQDQIDAIAKVYPEVSVSVVIQAAVSSELRKPRYKITSLQKSSAVNDDKNPNADPSSRSHARKGKAIIS